MNFQNRFYTPKPTKFVGFGFNQNKDKLGRKTVEEVKQERILFKQQLENERIFKRKEEPKDNEKIVDNQKEYLGAFRNLNKK